MVTFYSAVAYSLLMPNSRPYEKSLNELEGVDWGEPIIGTTLAGQLHYARRRPMEDLAEWEIRTLLAHRVGLEHIFPLAAELVLQEPLRQSKFYPGDLLRSVLAVPRPYWPDDLIEEVRSAINALRQDASLAQDVPQEAAAEILTWNGPREEPKVQPAHVYLQWRRECEALLAAENPGYANKVKAGQTKAKRIKAPRTGRKR